VSSALRARRAPTRRRSRPRTRPARRRRRAGAGGRCRARSCARSASPRAPCRRSGRRRRRPPPTPASRAGPPARPPPAARRSRRPTSARRSPRARRRAPPTWPSWRRGPARASGGSLAARHGAGRGSPPARKRAEQGRGGERDERPGHPHRVETVETAPADRARAARRRPRPDQPPTSACPELAGRPRGHVTMFHATAAARPAAITTIPVSPSMVTMPPTVSATAVPRSSGPRRLKVAASSAACSGLAARVATSPAIAFDACAARSSPRTPRPARSRGRSPHPQGSAPDRDHAPHGLPARRTAHGHAQRQARRAHVREPAAHPARADRDAHGLRLAALKHAAHMADPERPALLLVLGHELQASGLAG
jgi:hypothetical protein